MPGTTEPRGAGDAPSLIATPSQLDITGERRLGQRPVRQPLQRQHPADQGDRQLSVDRPRVPDRPGRRPRTSPHPTPACRFRRRARRRPAPITFNVPPHLSRLDADMIWPDPTNSSVLEFVLFNPQGAIVQQSYDDGTPGRVGRSPNIQHAEVTDPDARQVDGEVPVGRHRRLRRGRARGARHLPRSDVVQGLRAGLHHRARHPAGHDRAALRGGNTAAGRDARPGGRPSGVAAAVRQQRGGGLGADRAPDVDSVRWRQLPDADHRHERAQRRADRHVRDQRPGREPGPRRQPARDRRQCGQRVQLLPGQPQRHGRRDGDHAADGERRGDRRRASSAPPTRPPDSGRSTSCCDSRSAGTSSTRPCSATSRTEAVARSDPGIVAGPPGGGPAAVQPRHAAGQPLPQGRSCGWPRCGQPARRRPRTRKR